MYEAYRKDEEEQQRAREFWLFALGGAVFVVALADWNLGPWPWHVAGALSGVLLWPLVRLALASRRHRIAFYTAFCALLHLLSYRPPHTVFIGRIERIPVGTPISSLRERFRDMPVFRAHFPPDDYTGTLEYSVGHPSPTAYQLMAVTFVDGKVVRTKLVQHR